MTVIAIALRLGLPLEKITAALRQVHLVKGRVEVVPTPGTDYTVLIDYAHTPDALENVLRSVQGAIARAGSSLSLAAAGTVIPSSGPLWAGSA